MLVGNVRNSVLNQLFLIACVSRANHSNQIQEPSKHYQTSSKKKRMGTLPDWILTIKARMGMRW